MCILLCIRTRTAYACKGSVCSKASFSPLFLFYFYGFYTARKKIGEAFDAVSHQSVDWLPD